MQFAALTTAARPAFRHMLALRLIGVERGCNTLTGHTLWRPVRCYLLLCRDRHRGVLRGALHLSHYLQLLIPHKSTVKPLYGIKEDFEARWSMQNNRCLLWQTNFETAGTSADGPPARSKIYINATTVCIENANEGIAWTPGHLICASLTSRQKKPSRTSEKGDSIRCRLAQTNVLSSFSSHVHAVSQVN